jgi:hypothetical protein
MSCTQSPLQCHGPFCLKNCHLCCLLNHFKIPLKFMQTTLFLLWPQRRHARGFRILCITSIKLLFMLACTCVCSLVRLVSLGIVALPSVLVDPGHLLLGVFWLSWLGRQIVSVRAQVMSSSAWCFLTFRTAPKWVYFKYTIPNPVTGILPIEQALLNVGDDGSLENTDAIDLLFHVDPAFLSRYV